MEMEFRPFRLLCTDIYIYNKAQKIADREHIWFEVEPPLTIIFQQHSDLVEVRKLLPTN